jgi:hypothetical protein
MTMGLACDREGYDLRLPKCPKCGSRGCPEIHRILGICSVDQYRQAVDDANRMDEKGVVVPRPKRAPGDQRS